MGAAVQGRKRLETKENKEENTRNREENEGKQGGKGGGREKTPSLVGEEISQGGGKTSLVERRGSFSLYKREKQL
jgi:hypothetical protein